MTEPASTSATGIRRRLFLKVLGASGAATAAAGCAPTSTEKLIPYLTQPDETVPGVSLYYASTCRECSTGCGVLLETRDGRTFKLEGNPAHPVNRGALCARGQAAVQGLYNPDRYQSPMIRKNGVLTRATWDEAMQLLNAKLGELRSRGQASSAVFINQHESGSFPGFLDGWLSAFGMPRHLSYDMLADAAMIQANRAAYGAAWPALKLTEAKLIVSFGADFLDGWGASVPQQLEWADARAKLSGAPRLVYIGPRRSLTGLNADEWLACKPGSELAIANALRGSGSVDAAAAAGGISAESLRRLASDLAASKPVLVLAGSGGGSAGDLAAAVAELNKSGGAVGSTIRPDQAVSGFEGMTSDAELVRAFERMSSGQVSMLLVRGSNPLFTLPRSLKAIDAMAKVPFKVSFSSVMDETSAGCDLVLPDHHAIESWGDAQAVPGTISLQQPGMDPVYDSRQTADVLLQAAKANPQTASHFPWATYRDYLVSRFPGGATAFATALQRGLASGNIAASGAAPAPAARTSATEPAPSPAAQPIDQTAGDYYLVVYPSPALGDGRGANKPWLQELPDPVTKIAWQSWVEVHPTTAAKLDVESGDLLTVETATGKITAPAYVYLGVRPDTVAVPFGQGHFGYGRYAGQVGVNPFDLVTVSFDTRTGALPWTTTKVRVSKEGTYVPLVTTEGSARQHGRGIGQAVAVADLGKRESKEEELPGDASHAFLPGLRAPLAADAQGSVASGIEEKEKGMYSPDHWSGMAKRRWAMTIDLARCTGCSACVTACYAENNIPTVGAAYQTRRAFTARSPGGNILRGREMAWLRLERYFEGGEDGGTEFDTRFVPMLCQHCGNAPCESVCPVYATYHSPDGLNVQVYNRCVGTRYCSNNCPYKVRYFNWFGYGEPDRPQYAWPERMNWQLNPDVTVRSKGVMEKCTFCVQRIREAEHRARLEGRTVEPDEFTTACAQACPSRAIVFGDAADSRWEVAKHVEDERAYHVFEELNTFTAVVYLKKVTHPAPGAPAGA